MAVLASTAVTPYPTDGSASYYIGKGSTIVVKRLKLVLTGEGGQTNTIGAAALGFSKLISCSNLFDDTNNKFYLATVDPVANVILLGDGATPSAPVDVTAAATYITVTGNPPIAR
jgi:hypothetical protein